MAKSKREALYLKMLNTLERHSRGLLRAFFIRLGKTILKNYNKTAKTDIDSMSAMDVVASLANWNDVNDDLTSILSKVANNGFINGAKWVTSTHKNAAIAPIQLDSAISEYLAEHTAEAVTKANETIKKRIAKIIADGVENGDTKKKMADDIANSINNMSKTRAQVIATTESHSAIMGGTRKTANASGFTTKKWRTMGDESVRNSHKELNNEVQPIDQPYSNGLIYPGDTSTGNPAEFVRCRCYETYDI